MLALSPATLLSALTRAVRHEPSPDPFVYVVVVPLIVAVICVLLLNLIVACGLLPTRTVKAEPLTAPALAALEKPVRLTEPVDTVERMFCVSYTGRVS